jgi:predicted amidohydrolase YtcJ
MSVFSRPRRGLGSLPLLAAALALVLGGCVTEEAAPVADLVITNGNVVTLNPDQPNVAALAVREGVILALGSAAEMEAHVGPETEVLDVEGQLVIPGFIEGHGHFMGLGNAKLILDLTTAQSWGEMVAMVAEAVDEAAPGSWIQGRGWHQEKWTSAPEVLVDGVPPHDELSAVSPDNPVFLVHASGHAALANARALEIAGIASDTPDPAGGTIVRDASGRATGLLRENADGLVAEHLDRWLNERSTEDIESEARRKVELAGLEALENGVTSFHDAGVDFATIDFFKDLADEGSLPIRIYAMVRFESNEELRRRLPDYRMIGYGDQFLTVRSIKRQLDGALGPHGAWLLEPYADLPSSTGLALEPLDEFRASLRIALEHGYQVNTHAIGDRANRETLGMYDQAFLEAGYDPGVLRWRIEHAQHVHPDDVERFAELGVIAAMQGIHCTSDAPWVLRRLGEERAESGAYLWRDFHRAGVVVTNGTDVPVEDISPIASYYASVTRRTADGSQFYPAQVMTREEALRSYTINNAFAAFEEHLKGSLEVGKFADITVLDRDILTVPDEEILGTSVSYTILGGEIRFRR